jgi:zinc transporter ZupT
MNNTMRSFIEGAILLVFFVLYLGIHGGYRALLQVSPAAWAIVAGLVLLASLQKIIPAALRRFRNQPEPPQRLSAAAWRLLVVVQLLCCSLILVFDNMWFLPLLLMSPIFMLCQRSPSQEHKS